MNIPIKVLKSNSIANEKVRNQQKVAQKYYNSVSNTKQKQTTNENQTKNLISEKNSQNQIKLIHNIFSTTNLKEEIIRWFFSFGLNHKMVLSSIENRWLVNCLHYMFIKLKNEPNTKFCYLDGEAPECGIENFHHKVNNSKQLIFTNKKMSNNLFFHFFSTIEDCSSKKTAFTTYSMNSFTFNSGSSLLNSNPNNSNNNFFNNNNSNNNGSKDCLEYDFFNDINFYKCEESDISNDYCSYISLAEKIIENEVYFLKIFDYFSKGKAFMNFIPAYYDSQSKYYTYGMPDWFVKKEAYSLQEILLAYFEQAITVKFVLFHLDPNNYNYYFNKYLKNSYIKKLKEESDPAIYNENSDENINNNLDTNIVKNKINLNNNKKNNNNNCINNINKNDKNLINKETEDKNEDNIINYNNNNNASPNNFQLNGEYSYHYNYNSILDSSPKNENNKNLNYYFYNLIDPSEPEYNNNIKDDFEKNLSKSHMNQTTNDNNSNSNKSYSFIKSMHNVRIHLEKERNYPKGVYDIPELDCYLKKILKEKSEIISLFYAEIKSMDRLYLQSKGDKLMQEVQENKEFKEFLEKKSFNPQEFISFNRHSKLLKRVSFIEKKDMPFDIDLKGFITTHQSIEELLNKIIFLDIHQIFTFDDIILKRLFDNIYSIYTYKNLLDLIAEEDKDSEFVEKITTNNSNVNVNGNNNCKKKKKKKTAKKSVEKNENNEKNAINNPTSNNKISNDIKSDKNQSKAIKSYISNEEKNSTNNFDNIEDIKINLNENKHNYEKDKIDLKEKKDKDKTIYNNYLNTNQDVYNKNDELLEFNKDELTNNNNKNDKSPKQEIQETKETTNKSKEICSFDKNLENKIDSKKNQVKISKNTGTKNTINCKKPSKNNHSESDSKTNLKQIGIKRTVNKDNNNMNKTENKQLNKIDYKRANSNGERNNNLDNEIIKESNTLKEEKKENHEIKMKITNYKQMNLKDILSLEFIPKNNEDCKPINSKQNNKIDTKNEIFINDEHINKSNKNLSTKIKDEKNIVNQDSKGCLVTNSFSEKEKFLEKFTNSNLNLPLNKSTENQLTAFTEYLKENINKANLTQKEKESIMKTPINLENLQIINNLNLFNNFNSTNNVINLSDIVNSNESENLKNENSQDKNENDTDTAYSSSNQSETNNYNPDNTEIPNLHENSINSFEVNKIKRNLNSNSNIINLKNNLRCINTRKSNSNINRKKTDLTDVKNINNYLISPKKTNENNNLIKINLDCKYKNNFTKNKDNDPKNRLNNKENGHLNLSYFDHSIENKSKKSDLKENKKSIDENLTKKENSTDGISSNKIHFSLNPLANIYKLSNKNIINKDKNINKEENLESKASDENSESNNFKNNLNNYNNYNDTYNYDTYLQYNNNNNNKNYNKNYSNYNLNSPNSVKSETSFYNNNHTKNDLYTNYCGHSASFGNLTYNPLYSAGINPLINSYNLSNPQTIYSGYNSPNNVKSKEFYFNQNYEKKNVINASSNNNTNNTNTIPEKIQENNTTLEPNNITKSKEIDNETSIEPNPNSLSESSKKTINKLKKNSANFNISKDDLNIVNSKALNFNESTETNKKQKISKMINTAVTGTYTNISNSSQNPIQQSEGNISNNNTQMYSNNLNLITAQAPVYQNYIPKNVNFRNFNFPVDMGNSFNLGYGPNFNNYNFFYPVNISNMGFMNMNMFGANANTVSGNNYYESSFYRKLNSDILEYNQKLEKNILLTKEIKSNVVLYLTEQIKEILDFLNIEVNIYGSFANELSIESSDIDLIVKYEIKNDNAENPDLNGIHNNTIVDIEYIISYLTNSFNNIKCMEKINPIYTASVPVIKLVKIF